MGIPFATPAAPEAPRTQKKTPLATKSNTRRVKWALPSRLRHKEDPSESPSATEDDEGEEQEDPDGTDADIHKEGPERRTPARAIEPEHAAIAEDVGEHEERVTEVESEEHGEDSANEPEPQQVLRNKNTLLSPKMLVNPMSVAQE